MTQYTISAAISAEQVGQHVSRKSFKMTSRLAVIGVLATATLLLVAACGERPPAKQGGQVAVKVNSGEISVHQINFVLQRARGITPETAEAAKRQVLDSLIDQELVVQQAQDAKLDRTPEVALALEAARREVLVRAYFDQQASAVSKPSATEVKKFYTDNPDLFSNRKIYRLEQASFATKPELVASVKEQLAQGHSVADIVNQLRASNVEVSGGTEVKPAEQIDLAILPKLAQAKDGLPQLLEGPDQTSLVTVLASKNEPVDETKALPAIEGFLVNKQKTDIARATLKQLRDKASIEYRGEFASLKPVVTPTEPNSDASVQKGISGLK